MLSTRWSTPYLQVQRVFLRVCTQVRYMFPFYQPLTVICYSDVLQRHQALHQPVAGEILLDQPTVDQNLVRTFQQSFVESRTAVACDRCARAKIRCNGELPCHQCVNRSLECTLERPHAYRKKCHPSSTQASSALAADRTTPSISSIAALNKQANSSSSRFSHAAGYDESTTVPAIHSGLDHNTSQSYLDTEPSNVRGGQEQQIVPLNEFGLGIPGPVDVFASDASWPWDNMNAFDENSPYFGPGYPQLFWRFEQDVSSGLVDNAHQDLIMKDVTEKPTNSKTRSNPVGTINPYANCPFVYSFRAGPVITVSRLIQFLQDQAIWQRLNNIVPSDELSDSTPSRIVEPVRDAIAAKIYTMLSKLIEKDTTRIIPHLFPPLKTIQYLLDIGHKACCPFYQVVHPTAFAESSWDSDEPYADSGLFFTSLMALGCLLAPVEETRSFSAELSYLVRHNIVENAALDEAHLIDKWVITAWIIGMVYSAWSGIKRHMELAEAYQGTFSAVCSEEHMLSQSKTNDCPSSF